MGHDAVLLHCLHWQWSMVTTILGLGRIESSDKLIYEYLKKIVIFTMFVIFQYEALCFLPTSFYCIPNLKSVQFKGKLITDTLN